MSGHQSARSRSVVYLTPREWVEKLGPFDLDPCCPPNMPWRTATRMLTVIEDGLTTPWEGRVWMNPPFGKEAAVWLRKLKLHGNGIALVPARTETRMFYDHVWGYADAVCFVRGRPYFRAGEDMLIELDGEEVLIRKGEPLPFNSGVPIALVAYGDANKEALIAAGLGIVATDFAWSKAA